jgi:peptidoglycan/LPS O-acetylase OafA/YrhL
VGAHAQGNYYGEAMPSFPRYRTLDAWRGLACLAVVAYHSVFTEKPVAGNLFSWLVSLMQWGWLGVPVFFVISGYCIATIADSTARKGLPIRDYFWRRFRRIFPPYWIALAILLAVALFDYGLGETLIKRPWWFPWESIIGSITLTETWRPQVWGNPAKRLVLLQAWTLCYEEQFYAVVGLVMVLAPKRIFAAMALVTIASIPCYGQPWAKGFFFDGYWLAFAMGVLVYHATTYQSPRWEACSAVLLAAIAIGFWSISSPINKSNDMAQSLCAAGACATAMLLIKPCDNRLAEFWLLRPFMTAGVITYSLYLIHWPLVEIITQLAPRYGLRSDAGKVIVIVPTCVAASLLAGWVFYAAVEKRFLNVSHRCSTKESANGRS